MLAHAPGPLSYAAGPDGLASTARRIGELLGEQFVDGGIHPRFGTRNMVLPLSAGTYLEVVEVLDHPASDKAPFGQAVRARSAARRRLARLGGRRRRHRQGRGAGSAASPSHGNRHRPDGVELRWRQIGVKGLQSDPQLPFFVQWQTPADQHPSVGASGDLRLDALEIAGDPDRVSEWLGESGRGAARGRQGRVGRAATATPGVIAAQFRHPERRRSGSDVARGRRRAPSRARTSGTTPTTYELENRAVDPDGLIESAMRDARTRGWAGRDVLDIGCGTGFHLPRWADDARSVVGVEPHPDLAALAARRTRRLANVTRPDGHGAGAAAARRVSVDVVHARWAYFFGPGCEPGLRRARPGDAPRRHGVRHRQRHDSRSTFGAWFRRGYPAVRRRRGRAVLVDARLAAPRARHRRGGSTRERPRGRACASSSTPQAADEVLADARGDRGRLRRQPVVAARTELRPRAPSASG